MLGFLATDEGDEVFVHASALPAATSPTLTGKSSPRSSEGISTREHRSSQLVVTTDWSART